MKLQRGFTLLEIIVAMGLSGIVMLGLSESYRVVMKYIERSRSIAQLDKKVLILFNQMEKDISTAFIPVIPPEIKPEKEPETAAEQEASQKKEQESRKPKTEDDFKKEKEERREKRKIFFMAEADETDYNKIDGKRAEPLKYFTFICTNPLLVYGERRQRLVRIRYEVVKDKELSKGDATVYKLVRKESPGLTNVKMKGAAGDPDSPAVYEYTVATGIKAVFIQFYTFQEPESDKPGETSTKQEREELHSFSWSEKKFTIGELPQRAEISILFWNERLNDTVLYQTTVPIVAYPFIDEAPPSAGSYIMGSGVAAQASVEGQSPVAGGQGSPAAPVSLNPPVGQKGAIP